MIMRKIHLSIYFNLLLFLVPLFFVGTLNLCTPHKPTVSQLENRTLKTKPVFAWDKLLHGDFTQEYEEYFADNFVFRDKFVQISGKLKKLWSLPGQDKVALVVNKGANVAQSQNPQNQNPDENKPSNPPTITTTNNVLVVNDKAMEIHTFNPQASESYAAFLNDFQEELIKNSKNNHSKNEPEHAPHIYSLLAPTQIEFIANKEYQNLSSPQKKTINYVNEHLNPQITPVNAYEAIKKHSDQYVYFRSDHHWTAMGAYYAYTAFMNARGIDPVPLEKYEVEEVKPFLGSLYSTTLSAEIQANPDVLSLYKPFTVHEYNVYYEGGPVKIPLLDMRHAQNKNKYGIFLSGDVPLGRITTEVKNGRKIAIIKDSYANAFVPFLLPHYQEIYIIDPRQFQQDIFQFIDGKGIQDVLFLNYILVTNDQGFTDTLRQMCFPGQ